MYKTDPNGRVILINGDDTRWFETAIFVVRRGAAAPRDAVSEAERIINNHLFNTAASAPDNFPVLKERVKRSGKRSAFDVVMNVIGLLCCAVLAGVLWGFWGA